MSRVRNLGPEGSCVGFAAAAALEHQISRRFAKEVAISPRYIYYHARKRGGFSTNCDTGAYITDAVDMLLHTGAVTEKVWPYKAGEFAAKVPDDVERAQHYRISRAQRIRNTDELKRALQEVGPVIGGLCLFQSAYTDDVSRSGRIPVPDRGERFYSAAAVCFIGFDDAEGILTFRCPWGPHWGDHGHGYVSYAYAEQFLSDAWAIAM